MTEESRPDLEPALFEKLGKGLVFVFGVFFLPATFLLRAIETCPAFLARILWFMTWLIPWIILLFIRPTTSSNSFTSGVIVLLIIGIGALVTMFIYSGVLSVCGLGARYENHHILVAVGIASVPHLLVASTLVGLDPNTFGLSALTGLPGGVGLAGTAVLGLWQMSDNVFSPSPIWFIAPSATIWSGTLTVLGLYYMGATIRRAIGTYLAATLLLFAIWGVLGFAASMVFFVLALVVMGN